MAVLGNFIWIVSGGFAFSLFWLVFALLFVWSKPLRDAFLQLAKYCFLPFGKEVVSKKELDGKISVEEAAKNKTLNLIWLPFGILSAIFTLFSGLYILIVGLVLVCTIIFFPIGVLYFPIGIALVGMTMLVLKPVGMKVVSKKQAQAAAVVNEMERRAQNSKN